MVGCGYLEALSSNGEEEVPAQQPLAILGTIIIMGQVMGGKHTVDTALLEMDEELGAHPLSHPSADCSL
jgi:hypothetical protein